MVTLSVKEREKERHKEGEGEGEGEVVMLVMHMWAIQGPTSKQQLLTASNEPATWVAEHSLAKMKRAVGMHFMTCLMF